MWKIRLLQVRIVEATDKLVQASLSRLGEVSRGSPRPFRANGRPGDPLSFEQASVSLRRGESRLSENVQRPLFHILELSPRRRELAWARVSRLGEALQPERGSLAWARSWARMRFNLVFFLSFDGWSVFYYTIIWWHRGNEYHEREGVWVMNNEFWVMLEMWWTWDGWYQNGTISV